MSIWAGIKKALNSTFGTREFRPLNDIGFRTTTYPIEPMDNSILDESLFYSKKSKYGYNIVKYKGAFHIIQKASVTSSNNYDLEPLHWITTDFITYSGGNKISNTGGGYATFVLGDYIYSIGSIESSNSYSREAYRYDGNSWKQINSLSFGYHSGSRPVIYGDKAYIFYNKSNIYSFDGTSWKTLTINSHSNFDLSLFSSSNGSFVVINNALYLMIWGNGNYISTPKEIGIFELNSNGQFSFTGKTINHSTISGLNGAQDMFVYNDKLIIAQDHYMNVFTADGEFEYLYTMDMVSNCDSSSASVIENGYLYRNIFYSENGSSMAAIKKIKLDPVREKSMLLSKNTDIMFSPPIAANDLIPVKNCEVLGDNLLRVIDDGDITFRTKEFYAKHMLLK